MVRTAEEGFLGLKLWINTKSSKCACTIITCTLRPVNNNNVIGDGKYKNSFNILNIFVFR